MAVLYSLGPPESTDWCLETDGFVAALSQLWPAADIAISGSDALPQSPSVTWSVRNWSGDEEVPPWLDGSLDHARQTSFLRGDPDLVAEYILWFQALNPAQPLLLIRGDDRPPLAIVPSTTPGEVRAFIH
jgi:hypothetical protein